MKTKIVSLLLAFGLLINVGSAASANLGYASDYFYRGVQKSEESIQASLAIEKSIAGLNASASVFTNQSVDSGTDTYIVSGGASKSFADGLLDAYVGLNHVEDVAGLASSEVQITVSIDSALSPTLSAYRDLDDSLYTFELGLSHGIDLGFADLGLDALAGNTEISSTDSRTYYVAGAELSKSLSDSASISVSSDYVDAEDIDREFVFSSSLTLKF
jgi:hypothetical protein